VARAPKYKQAAKTIMSPSTAVMVDKAQRKGWYGGHSKTTKPGDLFIIDGKHVGFINQVRNDGTFATIEGNASDGVRALIRSWRDGWKVISIPGVGAPGPAAVVDGYGFDDTRVKLYGGWPTPEARNQQMRKFAAANPEFWTQAIRVARSEPLCVPRRSRRHLQPLDLRPLAARHRQADARQADGAVEQEA
jgi:hypothetical protein